MASVTVAGTICVDVIPKLLSARLPDPGGPIETGPVAVQAGGSVYNTGAALAALGVEVRALAAVGNDSLGQLLERLLRDAGMRPDLIETSEFATSCSIVWEPPGQDRGFLHDVGANKALREDLINGEGTELLHLGYPNQLMTLLSDGAAPLQRLLERARADGTTTSIDFAVVGPESESSRLDWDAILAAVLPAVDVITPSIEDLVSIGQANGTSLAEVEAAARSLVDRGAGVAVVSAGAAGVCLVAGSRERLARGGRVLAALPASWDEASCWGAAVQVKPDSSLNGAGDTMTAGVLYALLHGYSPTQAADFACRLAAARIENRPMPSALKAS